MATQGYAYIESILKEWYAKAIVNQIYVKSPLWGLIKKTSVGVGGKRVYIPLRKTLSEAVGGLIAGDYTLPTAGKIGFDHTWIYQKRNYGVIQVDGLGMAASKAGKGGWVDIFAAETKGIAEAFAIDIDQQLMGRGTAILGTCMEDLAASLGTEEMEVDAPHGIDHGTDPTFGWMRAGMLVDIWDVGSNVILPTAQDMVIESVDYTGNHSITFESGWAATTSSNALQDGDFILRANTGSFDGSSDTIEDDHTTGNAAIMGIDRIVDNDQDDTAGDDIDTFQGVAAVSGSNPWWRASKMRTSDTILTEMKIQEDLDTIETAGDGDSPNLALTTYALRNKLIEIVKSEKMVDTMDFVAGWKGIRYQGGAVSLPIMVHRYCPTKYWYYLNMKYLNFYTLKKLVWDNSGGGIIKPVDGEDQFKAWFKMYGNLGTDKRNALGKSTNYTTS